jgi:NAD-dependent dihydropyrimidine dehydrogenase PreA subunit
MYKTLSKADLPGMIENWQTHTTVVAPVRRGNLIEFCPVDGAAQADLYFEANTRYPPKSLFLPQSEALFHVQDVEFDPLDADISPRVVVGIRACDARAVQLLDGVFLTDENRDPYWAERREQTTVVALGCAAPCATCFCSAVGSGPFDARGADVMLTESGEGYVAEVRSEKGEALFGSLPDASPAQVQAAEQVQAGAVAQMEPPFETEGIKDRLYSLFESDFWVEIQESCLGCGVCTFMCPTCYCFDIVDEVQRSERVRNWDTCMFRIYSQEASGHNPRPTNVERTRQRIMHKYAYFIENYGEIGCTGCGRCVRHCPVAIDIRHIIRTAQSQTVPESGAV